MASDSLTLPSASDLATFRSHAEATMIDSCIVSHVTEVVVDGRTETTYTIAYSGKCRIKSDTFGVQSLVGDKPTVITVFTLAVPAGTELHPGDMATVTSAQTGKGTIFRIDDIGDKSVEIERRVRCSRVGNP